MRRRIFVLSGLGAIAAAAFGLRRRLRRRFDGTPEEVERDLRDYFSYLDFDDDVVRAFTRDLGRLDRRLHRDDIRRRFLLSTDFFLHGEDERRRLGYRAFCDSYLSPCYSPFA